MGHWLVNLYFSLAFLRQNFLGFFNLFIVFARVLTDLLGHINFGALICIFAVGVVGFGFWGEVGITRLNNWKIYRLLYYRVYCLIKDGLINGHRWCNALAKIPNWLTILRCGLGLINDAWLECLIWLLWKSTRCQNFFHKKKVLLSQGFLVGSGVISTQVITKFIVKSWHFGACKWVLPVPLLLW